MSNAIFINYYKLKQGASVPDFLASVEKLVNEYASKQKGFISFNLLVDNDLWADIGVFESMEDAKNFANPSSTNNLAQKFYSFLDLKNCVSHLFSVERNYQYKDIMPKVVTLVTYKLKSGTAKSDFLLAADKAGNQPVAKDSVTISWQPLVDGDTWADLVYWESMDGPRKASSSENENPAIKEYLSFIDEVLFHRHFEVKKFLSV